ncbi:hypothetical protein [Sphingomonas sp. Y38-1Y]|uniref:hypothetical protein n=1 Tax=Sphingomonas sp. Y38-1Y TaxID=3078265 RepID=UPI0028EDDD41|nr:hypothetical protein [Sphingomonas sp. Y38-1Y]
MPEADTPAQLLRSRAHWIEELHLHPAEEIGRGPLVKMVRIALSDPDKVLWPYSIVCSDRTWSGKAILELRALLDV